MLVGAALAVSACGAATTSAPRSTPSMPAMSGMDGAGGMADMPGMSAAPPPVPLAEAAPTGNGLAAAVGGYTLVPSAATVRTGAPSTFSFHITGPDGHPVTRYQPYQSQLMLVDVIRSDLTHYQHLDTAMRQDGTWSVALPALPPGAYRAYVAFAAPDSGAGTPLVYELSRAFTVPGRAEGGAVPAPAASTTADGLTVTMVGHPKAGSSTPLTIGFTQQGKPVNYFQRYLDGYAHVTAFHVGDLAAAHLTPAAKAPGGQGTSRLTTTAMFPAGGRWRVFVQFETAGPPHTAAFTIDVAPRS